MADYRRMVSYMYQYEDGVKKKNVGYARVEARNGQCKVTLHMQLLGQLDSIFPTYLIQRANGMELIYLGDTVLKNQVMDSKLTADEKNIMNSGYSLSDMGGILIFYNESIFYATEWDDKPVIAKDVMEALKPSPKQAAIKEEASESIHVSDTDRKGKREEKQKEQLLTEQLQPKQIQQEQQEQIQQEQIQPESKPLTLEEELKIVKYKLPRGWKTIERLQKPVLAINEAEQMEKLLEAAHEAAEEGSQADTDRSKLHYDQRTVPDEAAECSEASKELPDHQVAKHFFDNYPRIYPFEDNEITACVKIEPKDIGLLPKEIWALSNNSFLMHSYYCYHHLIFAKISDRCGYRYILGLPGIYHNREKFMARMFGFEEFKSIRKRDLRQGDFGYWHLTINL